MTHRGGTSKFWLSFGGLIVVLLLAAVFTLGSLNIPFQPSSFNEIILLYALSTFIVAALLVFGLVLTRSLVRLWAERRAGQLGARFKTKMVFGAMGISLLPVIFMFLISYALLNRTLAKWFPRPLEIATDESRRLLSDLLRGHHKRLAAIAPEARAFYASPDFEFKAFELGADAAWVLDEKNAVTRGGVICVEGSTEDRACWTEVKGKYVRTLPAGLEVWAADDRLYLAARAEMIERFHPIYRKGEKPKPHPLEGKPYRVGAVVVGQQAPPSFLQGYAEIEAQLASYQAQGQGLRAFKTQMLLTLLLFTLLLLFAATWFALFLSKTVTIPIQALAEATREVSQGNFAHRVDVQAQDELGTLVHSFNQMTAQLGQSREQINEFTRSLQHAVEEIERRRQLMEAILENIPTGVLSLDPDGRIRRASSAVTRIFGERAGTAEKLTDLIGPEANRDVEFLVRKSLRMGVASKEMEIPLPGRVLHAAVTVSALGPRRSNPGFVVVIDDLTEVLRAQKATAWQSVAQRIAHEIKNPLTPIQLSAQRLSRHLQQESERRGPTGGPLLSEDGELRQMVGECAALIEREVTTLKSLVDEFSQFARFPTAKPVTADLNEIVAGGLDVFRDRLEGITLRTAFTDGLPPIKADPELLRRVVVNLVDNAAEALEGSAARELCVTTRLDAESDAVEIVVADSGHGISPEDKDKLFLPHFSTKERGTGLGLAIASRIVAEHHGTIRVEDNQPVGSRFVVRLPLSEVPAGQRVNGQTS